MHRDYVSQPEPKILFVSLRVLYGDLKFYIFILVEIIKKCKPILVPQDGHFRTQRLKPHLYLLSGWYPGITRNASNDSSKAPPGLPGGPRIMCEPGKEREQYTPLDAPARFTGITLRCYVTEHHAGLREVSSFLCQKGHDDLIIVCAENSFLLKTLSVGVLISGHWPRKICR